MLEKARNRRGNVISMDNFELIRATKRCDRCEHFGRWFPVEVAGQASVTMHCECLRPGFGKPLAEQIYGCLFWKIRT